MRISSLSARGLLSFDDFTLAVDHRLTVVVGPNGAGKSNLVRLIQLCAGAIQCADRRSDERRQLLAMFLAARRAGHRSPEVEVRVGYELTDAMEKALMVAFVRAAIVGAILGTRVLSDTREFDSWALREVTEEKLTPLFQGEIVVGHRGTDDADWECGVEFQAGQDGPTCRWVLLGDWPDMVLLRDPGGSQARQTTAVDSIARRLLGEDPPPNVQPSAPTGSFSLEDLLPQDDRVAVCGLDFREPPPETQRRFAELAGIDPAGRSDPVRHYGLARPLQVILRRALVQTSDSRLLPAPGWSGAGGAARSDAEERLPETLLRLKNGPANQRSRYRMIRERFKGLMQGRTFDAGFVPGTGGGTEESAGEAGLGLRVVAGVWVSVDAVSDGAAEPASEVPIAFAGAGAWEVLVLASALAEEAASVVVLDEPAIALHANLQRQLAAYLQQAAAQFLVTTHSPELLPVDLQRSDVEIVRVDRDQDAATTAWTLSEECRRRLARKLRGKGNERLPFAWRAVLCEGETDVEAVRVLAERCGIDLQARNVAVADCGGRENLPDYARFCGELGLQYLVVMDGDATKAATNPKVASMAQTVRDAVNSDPLGQLVEFSEDLETALGVDKQRSSPVPAAMRAVSLDTEGPAEIRELAEALRRLVGSVPIE